MGEPTPIAGECDDRFARVREAFATNFAEHGELGAAATLYVDGRKVVDLWGGFSDVARTRAWQEHTIVDVFSVGKGLATLGVLDCVQRGQLALDEPLARCWPELRIAAVSLRVLLSHRAGLPAIREPLPEGAALDLPRMLAALERQEPWWTPGTAHGYHVNTLGYLLGELVRRASGTTLGRVLAERVFGPLGADIFLGVPDAAHARVAEFLFPAWPGATAPTATDDELMRRNAYANPLDISGLGGVVNTPAWRRCELPSTNMHGSARGVARVYAELIRPGSTLIARELLSEATREHAFGVDRILERQSRFGLGFQLSQPERPLGRNGSGFGHFGAGGSLGFCDPDAGLAFGYVMNQMGPRWQNPRNRGLLNAVYASLQ